MHCGSPVLILVKTFNTHCGFSETVALTTLDPLSQPNWGSRSISPTLPIPSVIQPASYFSASPLELYVYHSILPHFRFWERFVSPWRAGWDVVTIPMFSRKTFGFSSEKELELQTPKQRKPSKGFLHIQEQICA